MEILDKLFGSTTKVRLMRLFLLNPERDFSFDEVTSRTMTVAKEVKKELEILTKIGLINRAKVARRETPESRPKQTQVWLLNSKFIYLSELQSFLINANLVKHSEILKRLSRTGKIKCVVIAGVFMNEWDEVPLDLLIVGDSVRKSGLESVIKRLEAEVGRDLKYAIFETADFTYRMTMYDKLVREILDYPHQIILDKIGLKRV